MKYEDLPPCTDEQYEQYKKKASEFMGSTYLYSSMRSSARMAIVDFLAWQDGVQVPRD